MYLTLFQMKCSWGLSESSLPLEWDEFEANIQWRSRIHNKTDEIDTLDKSKAIVRREQDLLSFILHSFLNPHATFNLWDETKKLRQNSKVHGWWSWREFKEFSTRNIFDEPFTKQSNSQLLEVYILVIKKLF